MELSVEQKILRYIKRLLELSTIKKPTEEDLNENKILTKELSVIMSKAGLKDLQSFINNPTVSDSKTELEILQAEEKALELRMKILKKREAVETMKAKLDEIEKENAYISGKPDKQGLIPIDEKKYDKRMNELHMELSTAKTSKEKIEARLKIINLKVWKASIKTRNGALKTSQTASKIANIVQGVSKEMGKLSDYSGFDEKPSGKKGKKNKETNNNYDIQDDFGFSQDKVFDKKYK